MSTAFALLLVAVAASTAFGASVSSQPGHLICRNKANGIRALVPGSCSRFYECHNGIATEYACPKYYDFKTRSCVSYNPGCTEGAVVAAAQPEAKKVV
ncbi:hypothetical protein KR074_008307, partial [Drosophila pseudoananassae]